LEDCGNRVRVKVHLNRTIGRGTVGRTVLINRGGSEGEREANRLIKGLADLLFDGRATNEASVGAIKSVLALDEIMADKSVALSDVSADQTAFGVG